MARGADYAWHTVAPATLKAAGVTFVVRYVSHDLTKLSLPTVAAIDAMDKVGAAPGGFGTERSRRAFTTAAGTPRKTTRTEVAGLLGAGLGVAVVWEDTAAAAAQGYARGVSDATEANRQTVNLGLAGTPVYFAADYDAPPGDQTQINAYLDGAASVIGRPRVGVYGGFWVVSRARAAAKAAYYWGTYAWSGTNWGDCGWAPHLMQQTAVSYIGGVQCDIDYSAATDFGQYRGAGGDPVLAEGATGTAVTRAQTRLNIWGAHLTADGVFGPATTTAVRTFQQAHGLSADGIIGPATWAALNKTPPPPPGQLPAPTALKVDRTRLAIGWSPVTGAGLTGYTAVAYGTDGHELARAVTPAGQTWCMLNNLGPGWVVKVRVWANGGQVAPGAAEMTVTLP